MRSYDARISSKSTGTPICLYTSRTQNMSSGPTPLSNVICIQLTYLKERKCQFEYVFTIAGYERHFDFVGSDRRCWLCQRRIVLHSSGVNLASVYDVAVE